jgi:hypothetical protein
MYDIYIRNAELKKVGVLNNFNSLELNIKFNDVGTWALEISDDDPASEALKEVRRQGSGLGGIVVERDGQVIFSGPIRRVEMTGDWQSENGNVTLFSGVDDNGLLATRLSLPSPYTWPSGTGYGWYTDSGYMEDVMIRLVENNIGDSAPYDRVIVGLRTFPSQQRGYSVSVRSRMHTLLEKLQEVALAGGDYGFRCLQKEMSFIDFEVYEPEDKTAEVIFSKELGNLGGFKYVVEAPEANLVIGGGKGEGTARNFSFQADDPSRSLYGTIEAFTDQRDSEPTELTQLISQHLQEKAEKTQLELSPLDVYPTRYKLDYEIGDKVAVRIKDETLYDIVRAVTIKLTKDGNEIVPVIGTPNVGTSFRLLDNYRDLESRVDSLERRY